MSAPPSQSAAGRVAEGQGALRHPFDRLRTRLRIDSATGARESRVKRWHGAGWLWASSPRPIARSDIYPVVQRGFVPCHAAETPITGRSLEKRDFKINR